MKRSPKTQLFFYGLTFRPHLNDETVTENGTFRRRSPKIENAVFLFSCGPWTWIFLKTDKKSCVFKRKRIRVDKALQWVTGDQNLLEIVISLQPTQAVLDFMTVPKRYLARHRFCVPCLYHRMRRSDCSPTASFQHH